MNIGIAICRYRNTDYLSAKAAGFVIITVMNVQEIDFAGLTRDKLFIIAGPCVIESRKVVLDTAEVLKELSISLDIPTVFKCSYDKANRSSLTSYRGPGPAEGLKLLGEVRERFSIPILTDVHSVQEIEEAAKVVDILQIPAFMCRQTDLILAASATGKPVNVKKGQFLAPWDVKNIIDKFVSTGNTKISITERGVSFGYNNLVVDFRSMAIMRRYGHPVVFDLTHSVQQPGGLGASSGGQSEFAYALARAAVGAGVDGLFMEVHPEPEKALCDGPNMIRLGELEEMLVTLKRIYEITKKYL
jgi:2-dehydro-3-deoxyphosphooctonate aldolase (KDO 8-P synthase)